MRIISLLLVLYTSNAELWESQWVPIVEQIMDDQHYMHTQLEEAAENLYHIPFIDFLADNNGVVGVRGVDGSKKTLHPNPFKLNPEQLAKVEEGVRDFRYKAKNDFVTDMWVTDQTGKIVFYTNLENFTEFKTKFNVPPNATRLTPYCVCATHGVFTGPIYTVQWERDARKLMKTLRKRPVDGPISFHSPGTAIVKHQPYTQLHLEALGYPIKLTVHVAGAGDSTDKHHPQTPEHFVKYIYVKDQHMRVIGYQEFTGKETDPAKLNIELPIEVRWVKAFEYCNLHGLWLSDRVVVQTVNDATQATIAYKKRLNIIDRPVREEEKEDGKEEL